MTDETALFEKVGSAGTMAFVWNAGGEGDLRELLETLIAAEDGSAASKQSRETLEADAVELEATGFGEAAKIVREYLDYVPSERDLMCPYVPIDAANYDRWNAAFNRRTARRGSFCITLRS